MSRKRVFISKEMAGLEGDSQREKVHRVIKTMLKAPELQGLDEQEKEYILALLARLDKAGLEELRGMVDEKLAGFIEQEA